MTNQNPMPRRYTILKAICWASIFCSSIAAIWKRLEVVFYGATRPNRVDSIVFLCIFACLVLSFVIGGICSQRSIEDADYILMTEPNAEYLFLKDSGEFVVIIGANEAAEFLKKSDAIAMLAPGLSRRLLNREDALRLLFHLTDLS